MPTNVRPDDPNATGAARLQAMVGGPREPGTPSMAGKPGVQAGRTSFPAPPAAPAAPPGRQPTPSPAPIGSAKPAGKPAQPGTPAAGAVSPTAATATPAAATPPSPGGSPPSAPAAGPSGGPAAPAAPQVDAAGNPVPVMPMSPTIPQPGSLVPGAQVQTPLGVASTGPDGSQSLALDANGTQKYKETMAALRGKFKLPKVMQGMQGLPEMELRLGASNFDPFTGRFHGKE